MELKKSQTLINLARAFAGECQAGARYQFLSKQAEKEGYCYLADVFKTIAKNEMAHAEQWFNFITDGKSKKIPSVEICAGYPYKTGSFLETVLGASESEEDEVGIYTEFAMVAEKEGFLQIAHKFRLVAKIENCHHLLNQQIYEKLKAGTLYQSTKAIKWKCGKCGHEATGKKPWEICPVCGEKIGMVEVQFNS